MPLVAPGGWPEPSLFRARLPFSPAEPRLTSSGHGENPPGSGEGAGFPALESRPLLKYYCHAAVDTSSPSVKSVNSAIRPIWWPELKSSPCLCGLRGRCPLQCSRGHWTSHAGCPPVSGMWRVIGGRQLGCVRHCPVCSAVLVQGHQRHLSL